MNGELKCHNSENIIIAIASIILQSYICEYAISVFQFLSISVHQNKHVHKRKCSVAGLALSEWNCFFFFFFSEAQRSLKRARVISMIHAVGLSWADQQMEAETNGNSDQ